MALKGITSERKTQMTHLNQLTVISDITKRDPFLKSFQGDRKP